MPANYSYEEYTELMFVYGFAMGMDVLLYRHIIIAWSLITQHLRMRTDVGGRLVPALELIGNMFNVGVMTMIQYREAQPQMCTNFCAQQVFLPLKYGEYYILTVFIHTTYRDSNTSCIAIMHLVWNTVNGFRQIWIFFHTSYSRMKLHSK
jgi:hypothetical protein